MILHAQFIVFCTRFCNAYRRRGGPAADANACSFAFPNSVWRNPYAHSNTYAQTNADAIIPAYSKAKAVSLAERDALAQPDADTNAEPLTLGFADGNAAAIARADPF